MNIWLILSELILFSAHSAYGAAGQRCQYPAHSHIRLPGSTKRHYLECESSHVYEEKECPVSTEFDSVSMICVYKLRETSQIPIWNSAEEDEEEAMINKAFATKNPQPIVQHQPPIGQPQQPPPQFIQNPPLGQQQPQLFTLQPPPIPQQPQINQQQSQFVPQPQQTFNQQQQQFGQPQSQLQLVQQPQFPQQQLGQQQQQFGQPQQPQFGQQPQISPRPQQQSQLITQWPNSMPIELFSSCTSDGWCPHDAGKLQYCDVNGEQFMQCSASGWVLKECPPGSLFTGHMGRCVDPRENVQPFPIVTQQPTQPTQPTQNIPMQFIGGLPNSKVISFGNPQSFGNSQVNLENLNNFIHTPQPQLQGQLQPRVNPQNFLAGQPQPIQSNPAFVNQNFQQNPLQMQFPQQPFIDSQFTTAAVLNGQNQQNFFAAQTPTIPQNLPVIHAGQQIPAAPTFAPILIHPQQVIGEQQFTPPAPLPLTQPTPTTTHATQHVLQHNFIIGGQQGVSFSPDQIAQLPRGELIFVPPQVNNSASISVDNVQQWSANKMNGGLQPSRQNKLGSVSLSRINSGNHQSQPSANSDNNEQQPAANPWMAQPWRPPTAASSGNQQWKPHHEILPNINWNSNGQPEDAQQQQWQISNPRMAEPKQIVFPFINSNSVAGFDSESQNTRSSKKLDKRLLNSKSR